MTDWATMPPPPVWCGCVAPVIITPYRLILTLAVAYAWAYQS